MVGSKAGIERLQEDELTQEQSAGHEHHDAERHFRADQQPPKAVR